jgi:hypothetical protein
MNSIIGAGLIVGAGLLLLVFARGSNAVTADLSEPV